mgnify:CR=1 FL=1
MQLFPKIMALIALVLFVPQIASVRAEKPASLPDFPNYGYIQVIARLTSQ